MAPRGHRTKDDPGAQVVADLLRAGVRDEDLLLVNEINVGEVFYIIAKHRSLSEAERVLRYLETLPLEIVSNGYPEVIDAARVKARFPLSYAEAFAVATPSRCPDPPKGFWFNYPCRILSTDWKRFPGNLICEGETHGFETT